MDLNYSSDKERIAMHHVYQWELIPTALPVIIHNCAKCGCPSTYECSGNFRVNANQSNIDVWLIYQCSKCKQTLNLDILSRTNIKAIDKELYHQFLSNHKELAKHYAFDLPTLGSNKVAVSYEHIDYEVKGPTLLYQELTSACQVEVRCNHPFELRLDRLLVRQLGLTRQQVKELFRESKIIVAEGKDIARAKIKKHLSFMLYPH
jgi:hypothetical protein